MSVLQGSFCKFSSILSNYRHVACQRLTASCVQQFSTKITIEEKLGIKPKPKKPPTTFFRFRAKIQPTLAQKNPKADHRELVKLAAEEWKKADEKLKTELQEEYKSDWVKYQAACKDYDKNLSPGDREDIEQAKKAAKIHKEKRELRKKREELGRPKKPPSPYVMFALSKASERGEIPYKEWQGKLAKMWASTEEMEKQKFLNLYKQDLEVYKQKLTDWEKKMMKEGKNDVVWS